MLVKQSITNNIFTGTCEVQPITYGMGIVYGKQSITHGVFLWNELMVL